ncbi:MAG: type II toxin-antitoxin system RelE/ParE family toxin [Rickettsiales bacterium]
MFNKQWQDYRLSPQADTDIDGIWHYTREHWGEAQADAYVHEILRALRGLVSGEKLAIPCDSVVGYQKLIVGAHMAFFRFDPPYIEVVRILHQQMDSPKQLRND